VSSIRAIQNYDVYGPWADTAGPNAPLASDCDARNTQGSGDAGISAWIAAGIPADRIVLGTPAYGHGFAVNKTSAFAEDGSLNAYPAFNASDRFQGSEWDSSGNTTDVCGIVEPPSGTYPLWSLVAQGFLDQDGQPADGIAYSYDNCSQTVTYSLLA